MKKIIGIDVGGTNIDVVAFKAKDSEIKKVKELEFEYVKSYSTKEKFLSLKKIIEELLEKFEPSGIGIGIAAWIKKGKIIHAPNLPLKDFDLDFLNSLGIKVVIDNDANMFAYYGALLFKAKNVLAVTVGTGIGTGVVIDGKIYRGEGLCGEMGHWYVEGEEECVCGGKGHLECFFSGWKFKKLGIEPIELIEKGEIYKIEGFRRFAIALSQGIMLLDPEIVVLGGRIGGNLRSVKVKEKVNQYLMKGFSPEIITLNDPLAVAKGAALMAV